MLIKKLCAGALFACANVAWGAVCVSGPSNLGTLLPSDTSSASFSATCRALGNPDPGDTAAWSFTNYYRFSLAAAASTVYGGINLNFTRTGEVFPHSPNRGDPLFMITTDSIMFEHGGVTTFAGTEGAGHHEHASIHAFDLEAGDYLMVVRGRVFNTATQSGWYNGTLNVSYANPTVSAMSTVSAPVPEPETAALLLLGIPAVALGSRRKQRSQA